MDLKFYLNKFLKVDNIENYTIKTLIKLRECYENFLEKSKGSDPDFPLINFGDKGIKIKGKNLYSLLEEENTDDKNLNNISLIDL